MNVSLTKVAGEPSQPSQPSHLSPSQVMTKQSGKQPPCSTSIMTLTSDVSVPFSASSSRLSSTSTSSIEDEDTGSSPSTPCRRELLKVSDLCSQQNSEVININNLMVPSQSKYNPQPTKKDLHRQTSLSIPPPAFFSVNGNRVNPLLTGEQDHSSEETSLIHSEVGECFTVKIDDNRRHSQGSNQSAITQHNGSLRPFLPQPLITVTINPLEKDEMTFVPPSPMIEPRKMIGDDDRKLSIGSASSFDDDPDPDHNSLGLRDCNIRRVSDISHINELRREISGLSHLASEFYEVKTMSDPDNVSLDSIHQRVLSRCAKYQMIESKSDRASRLFVIITTSLTIFGISCGFWYKNFSGYAEDSH